MKHVIFIAILFMTHYVSIAQNKSQQISSIKRLKFLKYDSSSQSLIIKKGYSFKKSNSGGVIIQNSNSAKAAEIECNCSGENSTGGCELRTIIMQNRFAVVCDGDCSSGCVGHVNPIPDPPKPSGGGKTKTPPQKYQIGKWIVKTY